MKIFDKKEGGFYNHKVLAVCVFVLMILCFVGLVYGSFAVVWDTPKTGGTISLSDLVGDNYTFVINVTRTSGLTNITNVTIYKNISGNWIEWASNTSYNLSQYNVTVPLNGTNALNGTFQLNVTVNTNVSGSNSSVISVLIDTIKPRVTLANGTNINTSNNTINYQYDAADYNLSTCQMYFGISGQWAMVKENATMNTTTITEKVTNSSLSDGTYYFSVYCNDTLGNSLWNDTNTSFMVDTVNPVIDRVNLSSYIVNPLSYICRSGISINITVNATDATAGIKNVTVNNISISRDSGSSDTWSEAIAITSSPVQVIASDYVGRTYLNNTITILFDDIAPVTTFMNDSTIIRTKWYNKDLHIALHAANGTNGIAGVDKIMYRNGTGGTWVVWSTNLTFDSNLTSDIFQFRANDTAGNIEGYHTKTIKIDKVYPDVVIDSLSSTTIGLDGNLIVAVNITDNMYGSELNTSALLAWHNGTGGNNASNKQNLSLEKGQYVGTLEGPSSAGSYVVRVNATDIVGNSNSSVTKVFTVITSAPTINANVSNNTYVLNNTVVSFTISGANNTFYNTSGSTPFTTPSAGAQINVTIEANASTTFVVEVHANKSDDNTTNATYAYKVDDVIPPISFSGLSAYQIINGTTTITALSVDIASGTADVKFYMSPVGAALGLHKTDNVTPYTYDWNTAHYTDGNYTINITAVDNVGNVNSTMMYVTINNSRPVTQSVSSGMADFGGTILENHVPQITGLNSTSAVVTVSNADTLFISGETGNALSSTKLYLNISADTAYRARVYFKLTEDQIDYSDRNNIWVYMDHNEDGSYEDNGDATYINQIDDYYNFYFTTTNFSIFAIGIKAAATPSGGSGGGGGGASTYPISFTSTPVKVGLRVDDRATFSFNKVTQSIKATKVIADSATFKIFPIGQTVGLKKKESKDIDLDGDGTNDLRLTLDYVYGTRKAFIFVKNISKAKKMTAFNIIDIIKNFYAGSTKYTAFEIIDIIRAFYGGS